LGESYNGAIKMFLNTEQRLRRNVALRDAYIEFMTTYVELSHMEKIKETSPNFIYLSYTIYIYNLLFTTSCSD